MTTFEITIITLLGLIAFALIFRDFVIGKALDQIIKNQESQYKKLDFIKTQIAGAHEDMYDDVGNHYLVEILNKLDNIEDNILDDLRDIRLADKLGNTSPNVPTPIPCYAPNGICTNPQMDCINCPKRGTGGTWSTTRNKVETTNKED